MENEVDVQTDKYSVTDLINHSVNKQPVEFEQVFNSLIADRLAAAVENKKVEVAQSMFNPQNDAEEDDVELDAEDNTEEQEDGETA